MRLKSLTITERNLAMREILPVHPGEMLEEEFLKPMGLSKYRLAKEIDVPAPRIGEIVAGNRSIRIWQKTTSRNRNVPRRVG